LFNCKPVVVSLVMHASAVDHLDRLTLEMTYYVSSEPLNSSHSRICTPSSIQHQQWQDESLPFKRH